jgi:hypothetical protein
MNASFPRGGNPVTQFAAVEVAIDFVETTGPNARHEMRFHDAHQFFQSLKRDNPFSQNGTRLKGQDACGIRIACTEPRLTAATPPNGKVDGSIILVEGRAAHIDLNAYASTNVQANTLFDRVLSIRPEMRKPSASNAGDWLSTDKACGNAYACSVQRATQVGPI